MAVRIRSRIELEPAWVWTDEDVKTKQGLLCGDDEGSDVGRSLVTRLQAEFEALSLSETLQPGTDWVIAISGGEFL